MHWFLWLLFGHLVIRSFYNLAIHGKKITQERNDTASAAVFAAFMAVGLLVQQGLI